MEGRSQAAGGGRLNGTPQNAHVERTKAERKPAAGALKSSRQVVKPAGETWPPCKAGIKDLGTQICSVALSGFLLSKPYSWMHGTVSPMVYVVDHGVGGNAVVLNTDRPGIDCCCG